jgi:hypothetical protein
MLLQLGAVPNLIVSSPRIAQAVLRTHDHVFSSGPPSKVFHNFLYGSSTIALGTYGEHWRKVKKLVTMHLFTVKKVNSYRRAREEEVTTLGVDVNYHVWHERECTNCYLFVDFFSYIHRCAW